MCAAMHFSFNKRVHMLGLGLQNLTNVQTSLLPVSRQLTAILSEAGPCPAASFSAFTSPGANLLTTFCG